MRGNYKHGYSCPLPGCSHRPRLYECWADMKKRCYCTKNKAYKYYGARGISVCSEWKENFDAFRLWALSHGYADNLTLDRIDVNGPYSPENCRWVTIQEQFLNRRSNRYFEYRGNRYTISQLSKLSGVSYEVLYYRLTHGWPVEQAMFGK